MRRNKSPMRLNMAMARSLRMSGPSALEWWMGPT